MAELEPHQFLETSDPCLAAWLVTRGLRLGAMLACTPARVVFVLTPLTAVEDVAAFEDRHALVNAFEYGRILLALLAAQKRAEERQ